MSSLSRCAVVIAAILTLAAAPAPSAAQDIDTLPVPVAELAPDTC